MVYHPGDLSTGSINWAPLVFDLCPSAPLTWFLPLKGWSRVEEPFCELVGSDTKVAGPYSSRIVCLMASP